MLHTDIGKLRVIVHAELDQASDRIRVVSSVFGGAPTPDELSRIKQIIHTADNHDWDIRRGHHFFVVDRFHDTDFNKATKYPLMRTKFFDLGEVLVGVTELPDTKTIADLLATHSWD